MIVPNMSLPEIRKSVLLDYVNEIKSKRELIKVAYNSKWIRNGKKDFAETIAFQTKSKNTWRMTVVCNNNGVSSIPYLVSYNHIGITASYVSYVYDPWQFMYFTTHFFKRYKERNKMEIEKPEEVVKIFFRKNTVLLPCYFPREDGTQQLFTPLEGGVGLGTYHTEYETCEFKTFVDNSLLRQDQREQIHTIWMDTLNDLTNELKRSLKIE